MKVKEITLDVCRQYLRCEADDKELKPFLDAAIEHVKNTYGISDETMDKYDDIALGVLAVMSDSYDNRNMQVGINASYVNRTIDALLNKYSSNLLPNG